MVISIACFLILSTMLSIDLYDMGEIFKDIIVVLGVLSFYNYTCYAYNWFREMHHMGIKHFIAYVINECYEKIKEFPLVLC